MDGEYERREFRRKAKALFPSIISDTHLAFGRAGPGPGVFCFLSFFALAGSVGRFPFDCGPPEILSASPIFIRCNKLLPEVAAPAFLSWFALLLFAGGFDPCALPFCCCVGRDFVFGAADE